MNEELPDLISTKDFADMLDVTTHRIARLLQDPVERENGFPKPYQLTSRLFRWSRVECEAYVEKRKNSLNRKPTRWKEGFLPTKDAVSFLGISISSFNLRYRYYPECPRPCMFRAVNFYKEKELAKFKKIIDKEKEINSRIETRRKTMKAREEHFERMEQKKKRIRNEIVNLHKRGINKDGKPKIVLFIEQMFLATQSFTERRGLETIDESI